MKKNKTIEEKHNHYSFFGENMGVESIGHFMKYLFYFMLALIVLGNAMSYFSNKSINIDWNYQKCVEACEKNSYKGVPWSTDYDKTECIKSCNKMLYDFQKCILVG